MTDFKIVDIGDFNTNGWLLAIFTVPVRLAAAQEYCGMVCAGDGGGSDVGWRRPTLPVRHRGVCGGLLRMGQWIPIPREEWL